MNVLKLRGVEGDDLYINPGHILVFTARVRDDGLVFTEVHLHKKIKADVLNTPAEIRWMMYYPETPYYPEIPNEERKA